MTKNKIEKTLKQNVVVSLVVAMIAGRIAAVIVVFFLGQLFGFQGPGPILFIQGAIVTGLPGIVIQLVVVPLTVKLLEKNVNL